MVFLAVVCTELVWGVALELPVECDAVVGLPVFFAAACVAGEDVACAGGWEAGVGALLPVEFSAAYKPLAARKTPVSRTSHRLLVS